MICPGGGYGLLAWEKEGTKLAQWLNGLGVTAVVLKYRLPKDGNKHPAPMLDAQRAMRMVRAHAKDFNLDPTRIGIMGFSAGGHLASTVATHYDSGKETGDAIDKQSCRPDFQILIYPVISSDKKIRHGCINNLLGKNADQKLREEFSNELQVTKDSPPAFLVHANDDKGVNPENSVRYYLALRKNKVPAEMHIYEKGGHGFGMGVNGSAVASWPDRCAEWLKVRGLLKKKTP